MGVTLERVQNKFACIIGELCCEPDILSQFAIWLDLRLAEYKLKGAIVLDCSGQEPEPTWLRGYHGKQRRKQSRPRAITPQTEPEPIIDHYHDQAVMEEWYVEESEFDPPEHAEGETATSSPTCTSILSLPPPNDHQDDDVVVVVKKEVIEDAQEDQIYIPSHVYPQNSKKRRATDVNLDLETTSSKIAHFSESTDSTFLNESRTSTLRLNPSMETNPLEERDITLAKNVIDNINTTPNSSMLDMSLNNTDDMLKFGTEILVKQDRRTSDFVLMTSTSVQTAGDKIVTGRLAVPQVCEDCGLVYHRNDSYRRHRRIHHQQGKRHVCDVCGKLFTRNEHLQRHLKSHTLETSPKLSQ